MDTRHALLSNIRPEIPNSVIHEGMSADERFQNLHYKTQICIS
jgi:hypothetical protein